MKRTLILVGLLAVGALICAPAMAQSLSLYEQEGTATDGYAAIDASGQGGTNANTTNWKYQTGTSSYTAIYGSAGWVVSSEVTNGDSSLDIECDIEMYYSESFENNKIYVHIGDPLGATEADKTAFVNGTFSSNNGQYLGVSFLGTNKTADDMEQDAEGYTGVVKNAMVATTDAFRTLSEPVYFDIKLTMSWDGGNTYHRPVNYGEGSHGTITDTLWWLVDEGGIGTYPISLKVELLFDAEQPDGNYQFDPVVVASPVM